MTENVLDTHTSGMRSEREDLRTKDGALGNTSIKVQEEKEHRIEKRQREVEK